MRKGRRDGEEDATTGDSLQSDKGEKMNEDVREEFKRILGMISDLGKTMKELAECVAQLEAQREVDHAD